MQHATNGCTIMERASKRRRVSKTEGGTAPTHEESVPEHWKSKDKSYGDTSVHGNSIVWQGDNHETLVYNLHHGSEPQQDQCRILLESLTFYRMDARLRNVATALPNTCQWLFYHEQFRAWIDKHQMEEHHSLLWIKGKPGSGKSTIMKKTLAWAEEHWASHILLSYFFNARSPHQLEKSSLGLYRSLLHQLLCALPSSRALFEKRFASKVRHDKVETWTETELQNFLVEVVRTFQLPSVVIFIDALDEGTEDDVRRMVRFLERLIQDVTAMANPLRICLSSRHYPHINIKQSLSIIVEDQVEHNQDIEVYIRSELAGGNSPQLKDIQSKVRDRSAGIFLWVVLVIPILNKAYDKGKSSVAMLRKLEEIPPDLHDDFAQIVSKDSEDLEECIILLEWVLFSIRPLSAMELYHAVQQTYATIDMDENFFLTQDAVDRYVLNCSRGLVELTKTDSPVVQFIHETVRDYLLARNVLGLQPSGVCVSHILIPNFQANDCHLRISEACLQYLLYLCEQAPLNRNYLKQYPLARYAAQYWWQHVQRSENPCGRMLLDSALELLAWGHNNLLVWVQVCDVDNQYRDLNLSLEMNDLASPLYYAASIGIPELVSHILLRDANVNAQGGKYGNALQAASVGGHEKVVQILVDHGADVNAQGGKYGNALQEASVRGHEKVVQILVDYGADVNVQGGEYGNVLYAASVRGHEKVVRILVDHGADVNAQGRGYGNALYAASVHGHKKVVQILLDHGADVNAQRREYGNALYTASVRGHEKVVQILLDHGADVNARGGGYGNALYTASGCGHEKVVQILLDHGADVNAQGGEYGNALQAASRGGHEKVVQILVDHGADVNAQGGEYGNALQTASAGGHEKTVQILVDHGANVNAQGREYGNALQTASNCGHEKVGRILADHGADINAQGKEYDSALQAASVGGHEKVVQILVDHGADVNARGRCYGNALQGASYRGHEKVVQILVGHGADVNAQGGCYGNALQDASVRGHGKVVQILVDYGADVNAQGGKYGNALQAASAGGHEKAVQILLDARVDVNAQGGYYSNALQAALAGGHEKVVQLLLKRGAKAV